MPDKIISAFVYEGRVKEMIHQYKFEDAYLLAESFSEGLIPIVKKIEGYKKYKATYIPLSKQRERYRGYNQSKLLADKVAYRLNMKVLDLLERKGQGETQVTAKTKVARKRNIRGFFSLQEGVKVPDKLILFDDVVTTGATVEEAVRVLKKAGAKKVMVVALAMGS